MSGYDESEVVRAFPPSSLAGFLAKPFGFEQVATLLRHVLGPGGTGDEESSPCPTSEVSKESTPSEGTSVYLTIDADAVT